MCWDNAVAEAFFAALYHRYSWPTRHEPGSLSPSTSRCSTTAADGTPASATAPPRKPSPTTKEQQPLLDQQREELSKIFDTAQISVQPLQQTGADAAHHPAVRAREPVAELIVEVRRQGERPTGHEEVSNQPLRRSTMRLDSGSCGCSTSRVASGTMNAAMPSARRAPRPITGSLSQINLRGTRPSSADQLPRAQQQVLGLAVGIILAVMNPKCAAVITSTGSSFAVPSWSGILRGGNHRSHCAASPGSQTSRSAGSILRSSGRNCFTFSRNHVIDPLQPTCSPMTLAGSSASTSNNSWTLASNGVNAVPACRRSLRGGASEATAFTTVVRETPNRAAIRAIGTPTAASLRINAQSSKVITPIVECSLFKRRYCPVFQASSTSTLSALRNAMSLPMEES